MGVWFHVPKSGYETKRHALEVVLMRVARFHLGDLEARRADGRAMRRPEGTRLSEAKTACPGGAAA